MSRYHCDVHDLDIVVYDENETEPFVDDNRLEAAIIFDKSGNKCLKRYVIGKCNESCPTMKELLKI